MAAEEAKEAAETAKNAAGSFVSGVWKQIKPWGDGKGLRNGALVGIFALTGIGISAGDPVAAWEAAKQTIGYAWDGLSGTLSGAWETASTANLETIQAGLGGAELSSGAVTASTGTAGGTVLSGTGTAASSNVISPTFNLEGLFSSPHVDLTATPPPAVGFSQPDGGYYPD